MATRLQTGRNNTVPRRTRSSTRTTAIRASIKRVAAIGDTPTLSLTPVEVDALVQSAASADVTASDAGSHKTVESYRIAMGSSPIEASDVSTVEPPSSYAPIRTAATSRAVRLRTATPPAIPVPVAPVPAAISPAGTRSPQPVDARGARRTRETLRADAIRPLPPPPRKR